MLGEFRNERINLAKRIYDIESSIYHIVARKEKELLLFETDYDLIDIENIQLIKEMRQVYNLRMDFIFIHLIFRKVHFSDALLYQRMPIVYLLI